MNDLFRTCLVFFTFGASKRSLKCRSGPSPIQGQEMRQGIRQFRTSSNNTALKTCWGWKGTWASVFNRKSQVLLLTASDKPWGQKIREISLLPAGTLPQAEWTQLHIGSQRSFCVPMSSITTFPSCLNDFVSSHLWPPALFLELARRCHVLLEPHLLTSSLSINKG